MKVVVDPYSGFCFGVTAAIKAAEEELSMGKELYSLGETVHNEEEMERLRELGLRVCSIEDLTNLQGKNIMIRAHGEPPETYEKAKQNNVKLYDLTCPIVLRLQKSVREAYKQLKNRNGLVLLYGKKGHAEIIGLLGQTENNGIVIETIEDLISIDFSRPISIFSQTTKDQKGYERICEEVSLRMKKVGNVEEPQIHHTICRIMSRREPQLRKFAVHHDVIIFVSGKQSSNGKYLYSICKEENPNSYFISSVEELNESYFVNCQSVGICGATSTPRRLLDIVATFIEQTY